MKMRISSKGKYALELMVYLGRNYGKGSISISEITGDSFSVKYMEKIAALLNKAKLIKSERGVEGGYKLVKDPSEYSIFEILEAVEDNMAPIKCVLDNDACKVKINCKTYPIWDELYEIEVEFLKNKKLKDIL
jgi:Rrf2 family protein